MNILLIGGTKGFGAALVQELQQRGSTVVTVGRSGADYNANVGNAKAWKEIVQRIVAQQGAFGAVFFVVGYARALPHEQQSEEVFAEHMQKNVGYVEQALAVLALSEHAAVVTTGSQWSWNEGATIIEPYIQAKHALARATREFANTHRSKSVVHLCVPPMNTPLRDQVWADFGSKPEQTSSVEVADPEMIAAIFIDQAFNRKHTGELFQIASDGSVTEVHQETKKPEPHLQLQ